MNNKNRNTVIIAINILVLLIIAYSNLNSFMMKEGEDNHLTSLSMSRTTSSSLGSFSETYRRTMFSRIGRPKVPRTPSSRLTSSPSRILGASGLKNPSSLPMLSSPYNSSITWSHSLSVAKIFFFLSFFSTFFSTFLSSYLLAWLSWKTCCRVGSLLRISSWNGSGWSSILSVGGELLDSGKERRSVASPSTWMSTNETSSSWNRYSSKGGGYIWASLRQKLTIGPNRRDN